MKQKKIVPTIFEPNSRFIHPDGQSTIEANINLNIKSQNTRDLDALIYEIDRLLER